MSTVKHFLHSFFYPESIAIVGASGNPLKMNFTITENLLRLKFKGKLYLVNPNTGEILGIKTYPNLTSIPDDIDLVVSAVPYHLTLDIVKQCVDEGIKRLVIVAGGFSEAGKEGEELHKEIEKITRENGIRVLGPNTLSPINTSNNFVISFHTVEKLKNGGLAFVFQSGLYEYKLNWLFSHLGISKILDLGNKMDINEVDALQYLAEDPDTKVITMHLESVRGDGRHFMKLLKDTSKKKPIIILKSGRTAAGAQAVVSHTGAIARENDLLFDSMLRQVGVIRAQDLDEFFDFAKVFAFSILPKGNRVTVVNLSGGEGVIAADACERHGLKMTKPSEKTYERLKRVFPPWEIPLNPLDVGPCMEFHIADFATDFSKFFIEVGSLLEDENVDCMVMQIPITIFLKASTIPGFSQSDFSELMDRVVNIYLRVKEKKPLTLWKSSMDSTEAEFVKRLEQSEIPVYSSAEKAAKALGVLYKYKKMKEANLASS
jgi:acetyltransferase